MSDVKERLRDSRSLAHQIGYTLRDSEWPQTPRRIGLQIANCQCLLEELEHLYESLTGVSAAGRPWREILHEGCLITEAREEIEQLTGEA